MDDFDWGSLPSVLRRIQSPSTAISAAASVAAPPSAALRMLLEMGLPREACERALEANGGDVHAAVAALLSQVGEADSALFRASRTGEPDSDGLRQMLAMGLARAACEDALRATGGNVEAAVTRVFESS